MIRVSTIQTAIKGLKGTFLGEGKGRLGTPDEVSTAIDIVVKHAETTLPIGLAGGEGYQFVLKGKVVQINDATWEQLAHGMVAMLDYLEVISDMAGGLKTASDAARAGKPMPYLMVED